MDSPIGVNMPYNLEAEQAILASAIMNESALNSVMDGMREDDFYVTAHKTIFNAISSLFNSARPVDMVTVSGELGEKLESIGGISYLSKIMQGVYTTENLRHYIDIAKGKTMLRKLIQAGSDIIDMCVKDEKEPSDILDRSEELIFRISEGRDNSDFTHIGEVVRSSMAIIEELKKRGGKITGIPTGFSELDDYTAGLQKSDFIVVAARPGMGKTSLALNIVENAAIRHNATTAIFSLEMSKEQLVNRVLSSEALIELSRLRIGDIGRDDMTKLAHALKDVMNAPIYIYDKSNIHVSDIHSKCRQLKLEKGLDLVVIDYLQLMQGSGKENNRATEIGAISRALKIMARDLNVPVITAAQLNRESVKEKRRPRVSDLRESGTIEQDADIILMLHDPNADKDGEEGGHSNIIECIIGKNRAGSMGIIKMAWRGEYTKFTDLDMRN
ncbi:MAG: replicative DNA helicase [Oscillospiraceae bacterium]|nr:replicative DNA helicase [Oscillospiraceae bacterium]